jgi:hypothetical protein
MPFYYAYRVDNDGHVISRFDIHADDDAQAIEKARLKLAHRDIEIWCLDRKVGVLKRRL